ncbi:hypothetical protein [Amnibacterium setariae]|uniref:Transcription factor zinc-finger domain-containing protein n=1 Tax=Amnibacterium setariae TaxID=2306585 RepID=A0A3A1TXU9_9MICO|nr:hypothetical protein [Amnibacterium setariae]RIX28639.1 hypothetical protein D1781_14635 [Amnibacterium setariae]
MESELGCPVCRAGAHTIDIPEVGVSLMSHVIVRRCPACATYWLETERYLAAVSDDEARREAPDVLAAG